MKHLLFVTGFFLPGFCFSQAGNCSIAREGRFELMSPTSGKTIIERTATTQHETNASIQMEASYKITWVNDCTYELRERKLIKGDPAFEGKPSDVLRVQITKVEGKRITISVSSNFSDQVVEREIVKVD